MLVFCVKDKIEFSLKLILPCGTKFGPGKAELMRLIDELGSISAAAKKMNMSYPKASRLVVELNNMLRGQLIDTYQGGASKGGAKLTQTGHEVLRSYADWTQNIIDNSSDLISKLTL